jgi:alginate O-acetyltransferase complex protein AlgI
MDFTTPTFAGFFLVVFLVYWALPRHRWRLLWLLGASCAFYMSWNPWFLLLLFASTSVDYLLALRLDRAASPAGRRALVVLSVSANLGVLAFFKYTLFLLDTSGGLCNALGLPLPAATLKIVLPLGVSFYTFEAVSYVVDVYRKKIRPVRNPLDYALYILFFPHLVAGPIVRPGDFLPQLGRPRRFSWVRLEAGVRLVLRGLVKKAVIANHLAAVIDPVFARPGDYGPAALWLAAVGYAAQIYADFSGYSDMAVGLAHALGFKLAANFRLPYLACSPADFWRRWHVSLSTWLRDYLYIPLGGSRHGSLATHRNLLITMTLGGLWHGAKWTFVVWGLYHGLLLCLTRLLAPPARLAALLRPAGVVLTFAAVCVGWVFFRAQSLADAAVILRGMAGGSAGARLAPGDEQVVLACLAAVLLGHLLGAVRWPHRLRARLPAPAAGAALAGCLVLYFLLLPYTGTGFIYFQF